MAALTVVDHPLVRHKLSLLRDAGTGTAAFRLLCRELTLLAAYEALRDLPEQPCTVDTPVARMETSCLAGPEPAVVGILRAGLAMIDGILVLVPHARVGHVGMYRDPDTKQPVEYYLKLPSELGEREVLVVDPMLATGGSANLALDVLKREGARSLRFLALVGCPEGVEAVQAAHPDVPITLAALDERLNDHAYIVPGLGDAGDRLFGTR